VLLSYLLPTIANKSCCKTQSVSCIVVLMSKYYSIYLDEPMQENSDTIQIDFVPSSTIVKYITKKVLFHASRIKLKPFVLLIDLDFINRLTG